MQQKLALVPSKNDTGYISEHVENLHNQGQTGGARDHTQEKGVPHFPSQMYPERGRPLVLPPGVKKIVLIRKVLDEKKGPKNFLALLKNRLGSGLKVDAKFKKIVSKKYPDAEVFASFLTVRENLVNELESLAEENKIPVLILNNNKTKKSFSLRQCSLNLKKFASYLEKI